MRSSKASKRISAHKRATAAIVSVSPDGVRLRVNGDEYLLRYDDHPWFLSARVDQIFDVQLLHGSHLRWPALDVDLHVDSLRQPQRFPLMARRIASRSTR